MTDPYEECKFCGHQAQNHDLPLTRCNASEPCGCAGFWSSTHTKDLHVVITVSVECDEQYIKREVRLSQTAWNGMRRENKAATVQRIAEDASDRFS